MNPTHTLLEFSQLFMLMPQSFHQKPYSWVLETLRYEHNGHAGVPRTPRLQLAYGILVQIISHQAQATVNCSPPAHNTIRSNSQPPQPLISYNRLNQSWPMHLAEEQQEQVEPAEALALAATEAETVDEEGAADVVGLAAVGTRARRRNGSR